MSLKNKLAARACVTRNILQAVLIGATVTFMGSCGGSSSPPPPPPPPPPDTSAPNVTFSPITLTVTAGATASAAVTATDNVAVTTGPTVACTNGGSFAGGTFTAPATATTLTSVCTATAGDAAGNSGTATLTVTVNPDTIAPTVTFDPVTLSLTSGATGTSTLTATDDVAVTSGPTVSCTNGGSFTGNTFTAPTTNTTITSVCTASADDAAGNSGNATLTVTVGPPPSTVTISGKITFDLVPFNTSTNGLNYNAITQTPARGIVVEALNNANVVLATGVTDGNGDYSVSVNPNTQTRIRAKAQMLKTSGAQWNTRVIDNTSGNALYALNGSLTSSGTANSTRNLNAASGWGGSSYTSTRAAAPFAILNPIYDSLQKFVAVDPNIVFPPNDFGWSINNRAANGNVSNGDIGTSSYVGNGRVNILGDANSDTDEYDDHVVVHEWGHYFEDQLSRSDSIGGPHSGGDRLDPRVAMGEGFGNALSGMMTDDPFYRDSSGAMQGLGFSINVESNSNSPAGWYNEGSVQSILYDLYDSADDGADTLTLGLGPIYTALTNASYTGGSLFTTIFAFLDEIRMGEPGSVTAINSLAVAESINGTGKDGAGETNSGTSNSLPVYKTASVNGSAVQVCSAGTNSPASNPPLYNKLRNRNYVKFTVATAGQHTLTMTRSSGTASRDPDFVVFKNGTQVTRAESPPGESETTSVSLTIGEHVVDVYDFFNLGQPGSGTPGNACYNFTVTR